MTPEDRELLKLAAKAAGVNSSGGYWWTETGDAWNPLTDDGDALRLAVKLEIQFGYSAFTGCARATWDRGFCQLQEYGPEDPYAATRRAIVRAAAAIDAAKGGECRSDGRCQYAIDHGAEGMGHCPRGKCVMANGGANG